MIARLGWLEFSRVDSVGADRMHSRKGVRLHNTVGLVDWLAYGQRRLYCLRVYKQEANVNETTRYQITLHHSILYVTFRH